MDFNDPDMPPELRAMLMAIEALAKAKGGEMKIRRARPDDVEGEEWKGGKEKEDDDDKTADRKLIGTTILTPTERDMFKALDEMREKGNALIKQAERIRDSHQAMRQAAWDTVSRRLGYTDNDSSQENGIAMSVDFENNVANIYRFKDGSQKPNEHQYTPKTEA
jgi:hypothetical protein